MSPGTPTGTGLLIPDTSNASVAVPEWVTQATIGPPSGLTTSTWDMLLITYPGYPLVGVYTTANAGTDFTALWTQSATLVTSALLTEASSAAVFEGIPFWSTNITTGTKNQILLDTPSPSTLPLRWRLTAASSTAYMNASDQFNQGTCTSGQFVPRQTRSHPEVGLAGNAFSLTTCEIPLNERNMTVMNPKIRVAPAKEGCYQPLLCLGPSFDWATQDPVASVGIDWQFSTSNLVFYPYNSVTSTLGNNAGLSTVPTFMDPTTNQQQNSWFESLIISQPMAAGAPYSFGTTNYNVGVSIWRGLHPSATITVKMVNSYEIAVSPVSPMAPFMKDAAPFDPRALQVYFEAAASLHQSYPADDNAVGAILGTIAAMLPTILPHIPPVVSSIRGLISGTPVAPRVPPRAVIAPQSRVYQPEMASSSHSRRATPRRMSQPRASTPSRRRRSVSSRVSQRSAKGRRRRPRR